MVKYVIVFFLLLTTVFCTEFDYYENKVPGIPIGKTMTGGLYVKKHHKCSKPIQPVDLSKENLVNEGITRVSLGVTIALVSFVVSIMFANPLTARLSNYGLIGGGTWALDGFLKIFIAQYLVWFIWIIAILVLFGILWWAKDKSVVKFIKEKKNGKTIKKER